MSEQPDRRWNDPLDFIIWAVLILVGVFVGIPLLGALIGGIALIGAAAIGLAFAAAPFIIGIVIIGAVISFLSEL